MGNGASATTSQYDGNGLRAHKTTDLTTSNFARDFSGAEPLLLTDGSNLFVYGLGGMPVEQVDRSGNVQYLHADQLGSIRLLTDATGAVVGSVTYDAYGKLTAKTGTAESPFGFAGEFLDQESGLYYARRNGVRNDRGRLQLARRMNVLNAIASSADHLETALSATDHLNCRSESEVIVNDDHPVPRYWAAPRKRTMRIA